MTHDHLRLNFTDRSDRLLPLLGHRLPVAPDAGVPFLLLPRAAHLPFFFFAGFAYTATLPVLLRTRLTLPVVDDADRGVVGPLALRLGPLEAVHLAVALAAWASTRSVRNRWRAGSSAAIRRRRTYSTSRAGPPAGRAATGSRRACAGSVPGCSGARWP